MKKNSLLEAFQVERKENIISNISDYDIFRDKKLLDDLRTKIVENLIDQEIPDDESRSEFINNEINRTIEGIDLTNLERNHLYNLIDNEMMGYGPLTELL